VPTRAAATSPGEIAAELFAKLVAALEKAKDARSEAGRILFFPNGIELIDVSVTVAGVTAGIKVAGEKGIKGVGFAAPVSTGT